MYIKATTSKVNLSGYLGRAVEMSVRSTIDSIRDEFISKSPRFQAHSMFSRHGEEFLGELLLKFRDTKSQGKQWSIHTHSRLPVSQLGQRKGQLLQWGRMVTTKTPTTWRGPSTVSDNKTSDIRNSYFAGAQLVAKSVPHIQDTFSQVFETNAQHILGQNRGL